MSERRQSKFEGDRRVIERFSDSRMHVNFSQIQTWVQALAFLMSFTGVIRMGYGFYKGPDKIPGALVESVFQFLFAAILFQYASSIKSYLNNESKNTLEATVARQLVFWRVLVILLSLAMLIRILLLI